MTGEPERREAAVGIRISIEQSEPLIGTAAADEQGPLSFEGWLGLPGSFSLAGHSRQRHNPGRAGRESASAVAGGSQHGNPG